MSGPSMKRRWGHLSRVTAAAFAMWLLCLPAAAQAAGEGSIDHAQSENGELQVLYSVPALPGGDEPDLNSLSVTLNGEALTASAEMATDAEQKVRRTAILAIDVSNSMAKDQRFEQAKLAAQAFLDVAPEDVYVGIVAFAGRCRNGPATDS